MVAIADGGIEQVEFARALGDHIGRRVENADQLHLAHALLPVSLLHAPTMDGPAAGQPALLRRRTG